MKKPLTIWIFLPLLLISSLADAGSPTAFRIRSVYQHAPTGGWGNEVHWLFERTTPTQVLVHSKEMPGVTYKLTYSTENRLQKVVQRVKTNGTVVEKTIAESSADDPLFLSDGFPVPYDDLDVEDPSLTHAVIRKSAGGASFAFKVQRTEETISASEAMAAGMIDSGFKGTYGDASLMLVTVNGNSGLVVKQLWCRGEKWWLYEETPFRKSWRLP